MRAVVVSAMHMGTIENLTPPKKYARHLRRADELTKLLVTCTDAALDLGHPSETSEQVNTGLFLGTSFGPLETNFRFLDTLFDNGEGQASPTLFSHSVHNAAAGYLSRIFKIHGPTYTITSYAWPFLTALKQAADAISSGIVERAIVVTAELYSPVLGLAGKQIGTSAFDVYPSGAVCWILDQSDLATTVHRMQLLDVDIDEKPCKIETFLTRAGEEFSVNDKKVPNQGVLSYAFSITKNALQKSAIKNGRVRWSVQAPFGNASVFLSK